MAAKKSKCYLCGTEYEVCKLCRNVAEYTPWRRMCDSSRHFQIYMIVKDFRKGLLKEAEAKEQLANLQVNIDEVKTFVPSVQETLIPLFKKDVNVIEQSVVNSKPNKIAKKNSKLQKEVEELNEVEVLKEGEFEI